MRILTPLNSWFLSAFQSSEFAYLLQIWLIDTILLKQTRLQHWLHALEIWNLLGRNLQTTLHKGLVLIPLCGEENPKKQGSMNSFVSFFKAEKKHDADPKFSHSLVLLQKNHLATVSAMPAAAF